MADRSVFRPRGRAGLQTGVAGFAFTIAALNGCEATPVVAPDEVPTPHFNFTNGPASPNLVVSRFEKGTFVFGALVHFNAAADGVVVPGSGSQRPLLSFHYIDPLNHPFNGCGDDSSPDYAAALQRLTTPSRVDRVLELFRDRDAPISVYEGLIADFLSDPCGFLSAGPLAEGTAVFNGHFQWKNGAPRRLAGTWQGTLEGAGGGAVRLHEVLQLQWDKDGNFTARVDDISIHEVGHESP